MGAYPKSVIAAVSKVEALLGRVWKDPNRLAEALCHPSFRSNEGFGRLAFVGEPVLHLCVWNHVRRTYRNFKVDHIILITADNISRQNYARRAVNSGLYQYLHHHSASLHVHVDKYTRSLMTEGCMESAPEALGEMVEAIAGAVLLDSDKDLAEVWRVLMPILQPLIIKPPHLNHVGEDGRLQMRCSTSEKSPPSKGQSSNTPSKGQSSNTGKSTNRKSTTLSSINDTTEQK